MSRELEIIGLFNTGLDNGFLDIYLFSIMRSAIRAKGNSLLCLGILSACFTHACSTPSGPLELLLNKQDVFGRPVYLSKPGTLIFFFDINNSSHRQSVFYAQSLHTKYGSKHLDVVAVGKANSSLEDLKLFYEKSGLAFFMIQDHTYELHNAFGAMECCGSVMYFDADNLKHDFKNMMGQENLRQLVEKQIQGKIDYHQDCQNPSLFMMGRLVPHIEFSPPHSREIFSLYDFEEDILVVTFFSSLCGPCATGQRIERLRTLQEKLQAAERRIKLILVFMSPLNEGDITEMRKFMALPFEIFFSKYLFSDEVRYLTDPGAQLDPYTVVLDRQRNVLYSEDCTGEKDVVNDIEKILTRNAP